MVESKVRGMIRRFGPLLSLLSLWAAIDGSRAAEAVVVGFDQEWRFINPMGINPAGNDVDFDATWWLPESDFGLLYDGPTFGAAQAGGATSINSGTGPGPLGYGAVDNWNGANSPLLIPFGTTNGILSMGTLLTSPSISNRNGSYYRTTFFTNGPMADPVIRCMMDDGAVIFIDGIQVARINLTLPTNESLPRYTTTALSDGVANGAVPAVRQSTENTLYTIDLSIAGNQGSPGGLQASVIHPITSLAQGDHTMAVFLCSWSASNSDQLMALELTADNGGISPAASNLTRNHAGTPTNPDDDTFEFDVEVNLLSLSAGGWTSDAGQVPQGIYGQTYHFAGFPATGQAAIHFADALDSSIKATLVVEPPPAPLWLGENRLEGQTLPLLSVPGETEEWVQAGEQTIINTGGGGELHEMRSAIVAVPPGGAEFEAIVEFDDSSASGNFEASDTFEAVLVLNTGSGVSTVNLLPGFIDANGDGILSGYSGSGYDSFLSRDEFNLGRHLAAASWREGIALTASIPPGTVSAQLQIRAVNDDISEIYRLKNVRFAPAGSVFDDDNDGVSDARELDAGTDWQDPASTFAARYAAGVSHIQITLPTLSGRSYRILSSPDLQTWVEENSSAIVGDGLAQEFAVSAAGRRKFIAVQVRRGQQPWTAP